MEHKNEKKEVNNEPIAIIGIGCRLPGGANTPEQFWSNLSKGIDCITPIPEDRWNAKQFYSKSKEKPGKLLSRWGGYIDGAKEFDPAFFGISPREAACMDPQQRKLLEVTWDALEDGNQKPEELKGQPIGVFVGAFTLDYKILQYGGMNYDDIQAHTATGTMMTMVSNRISHIYDFRGPSMSIDTACSSSLVGVHLACQSIRSGESSMAIAGGTLLHFAPQYTISESKGSFLSPTGWSHAFDSSANGYVRAEAVGVVVLKKLKDAVRDKDPIYATIIGSASNQDGHTPGITVPSSDAQKKLMLDAYANAGITPGNVQYVEAHGTGTPVGDPIEANSIGYVLSQGRDEKSPCFIGSCKTNVGHTESAAGIVSLIKTALCLKNKQIPPHLHFKEINPKIKIEQWPYEIPTKLEEWPEHEGMAHAGVNSFGFGGTNSHLVLREAPKEQNSEKKNKEMDDNFKLFPASAKDGESLTSVVKQLRQFIENKNPRLSDLAHTITEKRTHHERRAAFTYKNKEELLELFDNFIQGDNTPFISQGKSVKDNKLVWVFTGMGPQWWAMGRELYEKEPLYKEIFDACDKEMKKHVNWSLVEELLRPEEESNMKSTWISQPANFALQISLAALWRSKGIKPHAIIGHSTGEVAAFYEAGVYSLEDAIRVIITRSQLQETLSGTGTMLALGVSEEEVLPRLKRFKGQISVAAVNSAHSVTLAGSAEDLNDLMTEYEGTDIFARLLKVEIPFHSIYMEPIKDQVYEKLSTITPQQATVPLYSTAHGTRVEGTELNASYWWKNIRHAVRFKDALSAVLDDGYSLFLEIGPHPVLASSIKESFKERDMKGTTLCSIRRMEREQDQFYNTLGALYTQGIQPDWSVFYSEGETIKVPLYPFKKDIYWMEPREMGRIRRGEKEHLLTGRKLSSPVPSWENHLDDESVAFLKDHRIQGNTVYPAAGYIEMAYGAMSSLLKKGHFEIRDLEFSKALFLTENQYNKVRFTLDNNSFKILSYDEKENNIPVLHAGGKLQTIQNTLIRDNLDLKSLMENVGQKIPKEECYEKLSQRGYEYGPFFQSIEELWLGENEILARISLQEGLSGEEFFVHPALMDACFQSFITVQFNSTTEDESIRLPISIESIRLLHPCIDEFYAYGVISENKDDTTVGDIYLIDNNGFCFGQIKNFLAQSITSVTANVTTSTLDKWIYKINWNELTDPVEKPEIKKDNSGWLILSDEGTLASDIEKELKKQGIYTVILPYNSENSGKKEILAALQDRFIVENKICSHILHMNNVRKGTLEELTLELIDNHRDHGAFSLINLANIISQTTGKTKIWTITQNAVEVNNEGVEPIGASAWGIARVLGQQELVNNWGGIIDIDNTTSGASIIDQILTSDGENEIALRGDKRYAARLVQAADLTTPLKVNYRSDRSYLITGAFGALGRLVSKLLLKNGAKHLILAGRSPIPPRSQWKDLPENKRDKTNFIKELESLGGNIITVSVDMSREEEVINFLNHHNSMEYPAIGGLFYSAGIVDDCLLPQMSEEKFNPVYDTKVKGAFLLHKHLKNLDHFVLFSSVASLATAAGQTNYAAGNAFLDALAFYRRNKGLPAHSINWGPWAIGMIKELNLENHYKETRGMTCILPEVGMYALDRIMGQDECNLAVCEVNWPAAMGWYQVNPPFFKELQNAENKEGDENNEKFTFLFKNHENPRELVEDNFIEIIAGVMKIKREKLDPCESLGTYGFDSMLAMELQNKLTRHFESTLPVVDLLSSSGISQLAEKLYNIILSSVDDDEEEEEISEEEIALWNEYEEKQLFPLSYGQKALWFLKQLIPDSYAYNIGGAMKIETEVDYSIMERVLCKITERHEALRTNFVIIDGKVFQKINEEPRIDYKVEDAEGIPMDELLTRMEKEYEVPFNLAEDVLLRIRIYKRSEKEYYMAIIQHHIISDASSNYILIDEIQAFYNHYQINAEVELPELTSRYIDFIRWQNRLLSGKKGANMRDYWKNHLSGELPVLDLPLDHPRPAVQTNNGDSLEFSLSLELSEKIKNMSQEHNATVFMILISTYYILLHKYSQQDEIIIGTPASGRTRDEFARVFGYYVNPLPLKASFKENPEYIDFLKQIQSIVLGGIENQDYPFALLVEELGLDHDASRSAIFQVLFVYLIHRVEHAHGTTNLPMSYVALPEEEGQFDLTLSIYEDHNDGRFQAVFKYNTDLFEKETMKKMAGHYEALLTRITASPQARISSYSVLTESEKEEIILNASGQSRLLLGTKEETFTELFEDIVKKHGDKTAVSLADSDEKSLTYSELNEKANQLSRHLMKKGVKQGDIVGVCLEKSPLLAVTLTALFKAGAAYLPLDPTYPEDRISYMIDKSQTPLIITTSNMDLSVTTAELICLDTLEKELEGEETGNPALISQPDDTLYVIFTSGSTGQPKGVKVPHKSGTAAFRAWEKDYNLRKTHAHLQMASFSFDVFFGDFSRALLSGKKLVFCRKETLLNIPRLYSSMKEEKVDCAEFVPSIIRNLMTYMETAGKNLDFMKRIIVGSDVWTVAEYRKLASFCNSETKVVNSYGVTEATIDSTFFEGSTEGLHEESTVPIGTPYCNSTVYILDPHNNVMPVNVPGELCIGGKSLAAGYLNDEEKTREKFITARIMDKEIPLYRTGDRAALDKNGQVIIMNRLDNQVKIRGYRIEIGEIEKQISSVEGVESAVVVPAQQGAEKVLIAYYRGEGVNEGDILTKIRMTLPDYMIPSHFTAMESFPLTPNGKVDRKELAATASQISETEILGRKAETMYQKKVAAVFMEILNIPEPGLKNDFFTSGGNSLLLIELMIHLQREFHIDISVNDLFSTSTVGGIADLIESIVSGDKEGSGAYIIYNDERDDKIFCFPPAGGYSIFYQPLSEKLTDRALVAFNYVDCEDKAEAYADYVEEIQQDGELLLCGYSLGGNMAFEVAGILEDRGRVVSHIVMVDSYRITEAFTELAEEELEKFQEELREHYKKHIGSDAVRELTLYQAKEYTDYCNRVMNKGTVKARVHFIMEEKEIYRDRDLERNSWNGSSETEDTLIQGAGKHADMLGPEHLDINSDLIKKVTQKTCVIA